ncbi:UNVERIFIED_CONTAM: Transposon Tf2-11 polyprotein [Sesamum angustifolium]|uniref:Transposon Tf2-11 polyprotein n=1 Tax=Sesamum angustifolium TaxID=2727405 RepID=A0AAW2NWJ7_9LAMI
MTKGNRLYVPKGGDLRKSLISECHDTLWAGHPEKSAPMRWCSGPTIGHRCGTMSYVRTCLICQQDKADHQKKAGLLQPLPIPKRPWESVSMDYISGLPKVGDLGTIIVVVDRLSNMPLLSQPQNTLRRKGRLISSSSMLSNIGACRRISLVIGTLVSLALSGPSYSDSSIHTFHELELSPAI